MNIEQEIKNVQERNRRVELDKAWEVSMARRAIIMVFTYAVALVWLLIIRVEGAPLAALVPVLGYLLSTLSLPLLKRLWAKRRTR